MDKYHVLITGSGNTSRANIEALLEDYFYANGPDGTIVLAYESKPSQGQVFAAQLAKDKKKDVLVYAPSSAVFDGLGAPSYQESKDFIEDSLDFMKTTKKHAVFILWDDEDSQCTKTLALAKDKGLNCYDLTQGLSILTPAEDLTVEEEPVIPEAEKVDTKPEVEDDEEEDDDEEDEEDELLDEVYFGLQSFAKHIAKEVAKEILPALQDALKKAQKGSKA